MLCDESPALAGLAITNAAPQANDRVTYEGYLKKWILPPWRACRRTGIKAIEVEKWLKRLCFPETGVPLVGAAAESTRGSNAGRDHGILKELRHKS